MICFPDPRALQEGLGLGGIQIISGHRESIPFHVQSQVVTHYSQTDNADFIIHNILPRPDYLIDPYDLTRYNIFTGAWDQQNPFIFTTCPLLRMDRCGVLVAQVDVPAAFFRDAGRQCDVDARCLTAGLQIVLTQSLEMRRMCQHTAWIILEFLPLLHENNHGNDSQSRLKVCRECN